MADSAKDGWNYHDPENLTGDARKICTIDQGGMMWVGIRFWRNDIRRWVSNGEPVPMEHVRAWRDLPEPAAGYWSRGQFILPESGGY